MRKLSGNYKVNYTVKDKKGRVLLETKACVCYRDIYGFGNIDKVESIILREFLCEETFIYHKNYIERLRKIFDLEIEYVEEDSISVKGFKNLTVLKVFLAMFRILFEVRSNYPADLAERDKKRAVSFFKDFCKCRRSSQYRTQLERFCYFYNLNKVHNGGGHGLKRNDYDSIAILKKSDINARSKTSGVIEFFKP